MAPMARRIMAQSIRRLRKFIHTRLTCQQISSETNAKNAATARRTRSVFAHGANVPCSQARTADGCLPEASRAARRSLRRALRAARALRMRAAGALRKPGTFALCGRESHGAYALTKSRAVRRNVLPFSRWSVAMAQMMVAAASRNGASGLPL